MKESLIGNIGTTTVNLLAKAMDDVNPTETIAGMPYDPVKKLIVLSKKQQRRSDRKAVRLRKKG